jgi:hypothetical protein
VRSLVLALWPLLAAAVPPLAALVSAPAAAAPCACFAACAAALPPAGRVARACRGLAAAARRAVAPRPPPGAPLAAPRLGVDSLVRLAPHALARWPNVASGPLSADDASLGLGLVVDAASGRLLVRRLVASVRANHAAAALELASPPPPLPLLQRTASGRPLLAVGDLVRAREDADGARVGRVERIASTGRSAEEFTVMSLAPVDAPCWYDADALCAAGRAWPVQPRAPRARPPASAAAAAAAAGGAGAAPPPPSPPSLFALAAALAATRAAPSSATAARAFSLGDCVALAPGFAAHSDAAAGPLRPADVAVLVAATAPAGRLRAQRLVASPRSWCYMPSALCPPAAAQGRGASGSAAAHAVGDIVRLSPGFASEADAVRARACACMHACIVVHARMNAPLLSFLYLSLYRARAGVWSAPSGRLWACHAGARRLGGGCVRAHSG